MSNILAVIIGLHGAFIVFAPHVAEWSSQSLRELIKRTERRVTDPTEEQREAFGRVTEVAMDVKRSLTGNYAVAVSGAMLAWITGGVLLAVSAEIHSTTLVWVARLFLGSGLLVDWAIWFVVLGGSGVVHQSLRKLR